jgi:hypothetical protein
MELSAMPSLKDAFPIPAESQERPQVVHRVDVVETTSNRRVGAYKNTSEVHIKTTPEIAAAMREVADRLTVPVSAVWRMAAKAFLEQQRKKP